MEDPYLNLDPSEFFNLLESNAPSVVEDIRSLIHENLNTTKEPWLVQGLYDYSLSKSSLRAMEILLGLRELHSKHLFDRISESLRSSTTKLSALIFLGFLVRKQPQWLHKISSHYVMRDLIKILKTDNDVVVLVNALLVLTALIPIIPNLEAFILNDIFEAFSRLAAWNYTNQPKQPEVYVLHLQIALYALFHRLYGMYPCNFLSYLRQHYSVRENLPIFSHTVKPMVETVRMHPLLVTASKDIEIGTARWKQMSVHDIVTECAKYSLLESQESMGNREDMPCNQIHSSTHAIEPETHAASWLNEAMNVNEEWTWPAQWVPVPTTTSYSSRVVTPKLHSDTSMSDLSMSTPSSKYPSSTTSAARTLSLTPTLATPTSPLKKDLHSFKYPTVERSESLHDRRSSVIGVKLQKIGQESTSTALFSAVISGMRSRHSSGAPTHPEPGHQRKNNVTSPAGFIEPFSTPTNPKISEKEKCDITAEDREVSRLLSPKQRDAAEKEKDSHALSQIWVQSREGTPSSLPRSRPDSLLQEKIDDHRNEPVTEKNDKDEEVHPDPLTASINRYTVDEATDYQERAEAGSHSPCHTGGLHMPDQFRISDFVKRVKRLRYFSQCLPINSTTLQGSPGSGSSLGTVVDSFGSSSVTNQAAPRKRSNSCPNLLQLDVSSWELRCGRGEDRSKEETMAAAQQQQQQQQQQSVESQTEDLWPPTPYEHLFFSVLPPSLLFPPPTAPPESTPRTLAPSELLDRYIDAAFRNHERRTVLLGKPNASEDVTLLKGQVLMLQSQLQFERHRREVHAERNRRLLAKAKGFRLVEEELGTLRLQLAQAQNEMTALRRDADLLRRSRNCVENDKNVTVRQSELRMKQCYQQIEELASAKMQCQEELAAVKEEVRTELRKTDKLNAALFDADAEMAELRKRANESRRYQQELKDSQYHLIAARETANLLQQQLMNPSSAAFKFEMDEMTRTYKEEMKAFSEKLERERRINEALTARLVDMEANAVRRETDMTELKRSLQLVKDEYQQMMQVTEQKYESIKSINLALEGNMLQLRHQVELSRSRLSRRRQIQDNLTTDIISAPPSAPGFSTSPGSPPSFSPVSGASAEQLSVSLAVEASENLTELYWQGIESSAVSETRADSRTDRKSSAAE